MPNLPADFDKDWTINDARDFCHSPATLTIHAGDRYWMRTCYEWIGGRWEGFVSMWRAR